MHQRPCDVMLSGQFPGQGSGAKLRAESVFFQARWQSPCDRDFNQLCLQCCIMQPNKSRLQQSLQHNRSKANQSLS